MLLWYWRYWCSSCPESSPLFPQHKAASSSCAKTEYVLWVLHCHFPLAGVLGWLMSAEKLSPNRSRWTSSKRCQLRVSLRQQGKRPWLTRPGAGTGCSAGDRVTFAGKLVAFGGKKQIFCWFDCMQLWK